MLIDELKSDDKKKKSDESDDKISMINIQKLTKELEVIEFF